MADRTAVCIIGAGAAGLCAARHLVKKDQFTVDVYEQTDRIGGIWNYTDLVGFEGNRRVPRNMYAYMRTNLPMECMQFPDFPSRCNSSFVHHTQVLKYLSDYAEDSGIMHHVQLSTRVLRVARSQDQWLVTVENLKTSQVTTKSYSAILICNGRHCNDHWPSIPGLKLFPGPVIHSHDYRRPESFTGKRVLVLGAGPSGIDIAIELADVAKQVILTHQGKRWENMPGNVVQENGTIQCCVDGEVHLTNGKSYQVDSMVLCTGYNFDFDFIDPDCGIRLTEFGTIEGLFMHLINTKHPTMALFGTLKMFLPFPIYHNQVQFFIKCLTREIILPSKELMDQDTAEDLNQRKQMGLRDKDAHLMRPAKMMWDYDDKLCAIGGITPVRTGVRRLYNHLQGVRKENITGYKDLNFDLVGNSEFVQVQR